MDAELVCWKCGAAITDLPMPLSRLAECRACHTELHVCKLCEFFDPHIADQCREPVADFVKEKEHANFCDYFIPVPNAYIPKDNSQSNAARTDLETLFGLVSDLDETSGNLSEADKAREKLNELFDK